MVKTYLQKNLPIEFSQEGFITRLAKTIQSYGYEVRIVGGAVRDLIMNECNDDFDLSTSATPTEILECLQNHANDYNVIPTGIKHGTVTINDKNSSKHIELTSLRKDILCDGRHAEVEYGVSWQEDALRRDFTFNSLSLDFKGRIFDYTGGFEDAKNKHLRFVGDPEIRIKEDALRILRFYRFLTTKSSSYDNHGLLACIKQMQLIHNLSGERIWQECKAICQHINGINTWNDLANDGILSIIFPDFNYEKSWIKGLLYVEAKTKNYSSKNVFLVDGKNKYISSGNVLARIASTALNPKVMQKRLKFSNSLTKDIHACQIASKIDFNNANLRRHLWNVSKFKLRDWILTISAKRNINNEPDVNKNIDFVFKKNLLLNNMKTSVFPVNGTDLMNYGISEGQNLGKILILLQTWWLNFDTPPDKEKTLEKLKNIILKANLSVSIVKKSG